MTKRSLLCAEIEASGGIGLKTQQMKAWLARIIKEETNKK